LYYTIVSVGLAVTRASFVYNTQIVAYIRVLRVCALDSGNLKRYNSIHLELYCFQKCTLEMSICDVVRVYALLTA